MRKHRHHVAFTRELHRFVNRLDVPLASPDREAATGGDERAERPPVEL